MAELNLFENLAINPLPAEISQVGPYFINFKNSEKKYNPPPIPKRPNGINRIRITTSRYNKYFSTTCLSRLVWQGNE